MCTLVTLRRPDSPWPLLLAANRDELRGRPARPPGRHWEDRPHLRGGLDLEAGGTWLGVNDDGVVAAVLNRRGTLGPQPGKRSRGELVLEALDHAEAYHAADALRGLDPDAWRPFNLIVADAIDAFWLRHAGDGAISVRPIPAGLHMIEAGELDDPASPRIRRYLPLLRAAAPPEPQRGDWAAWAGLLAERATTTGNPRDAMTIVTEGEYGTVSSSLVALPRHVTEPVIYLHADGRPGEAAFAPVPA
jgi:uncharacterized protein with NRDE domain